MDHDGEPRARAPGGDPLLAHEKSEVTQPDANKCGGILLVTGGIDAINGLT